MTIYTASYSTIRHPLYVISCVFRPCPAVTMSGDQRTQSLAGDSTASVFANAATTTWRLTTHTHTHTTLWRRDCWVWWDAKWLYLRWCGSQTDTQCRATTSSSSLSTTYDISLTSLVIENRMKRALNDHAHVSRHQQILVTSSQIVTARLQPVRMNSRQNQNQSRFPPNGKHDFVVS